MKTSEKLNVLLIIPVLLIFSAASCDGGSSGESDDDIETNDSNGTSGYPVDTGIIDPDIPEPVIKVLFEYTTGGDMSYRNIKDKVSMNLRNTCVTDPDKTEGSGSCLENWEEKYYIKYKWEMSESPTPLIEKSQLKLPDSKSNAGQWIPDIPEDDPKRAEFTGLKITPVRTGEINNDFDEFKCSDLCGDDEPGDTENEFYPEIFSKYLICRQKYCERYKTKYYKVNVQAVTVDRKTAKISETADVTVIPKIIPQARVVAQLSWDKGFKTSTESESGKEGVKVDLDIHMIKKTSLEAPVHGYEPLEGVLGTNELAESEVIYHAPTNPDDYRYFRHDDCSFSDKGIKSADIKETISWNASLDLDNTWGGNNFETPETIGLGSIADEDHDYAPDIDIPDDQYLIVIGYVNCMSKYEDGKNRCEEEYSGDDSAYEVNARVNILVDGEEVPRGPRLNPFSDRYSTSTKDFKIRYGEWKVIAVIKWDSSLPGYEKNPKAYKGNAIVTEVAMPYFGIETDALSYKTCKYPLSEAILVPIWDETAYYDFVYTKRDPNDKNSPTIGECY